MNITHRQNTHNNFLVIKDMNRETALGQLISRKLVADESNTEIPEPSSTMRGPGSVKVNSSPTNGVGGEDATKDDVKDESESPNSHPHTAGETRVPNSSVSSKLPSTQLC